MPIYDYVCLDCAERTEVIHAVDASGPTTCQTCGGTMRKALSAPTIVFKGSGWAKKDARSAKHTKSTDDRDKPTTDKPADAPAKPAAKEAAGTSSD